MISKELAIKAAKEIFSHKFHVFVAFYMNPKEIMACKALDLSGKPIFEYFNEETMGWLFFLDKMPLAEGCHPCEYLFVIDEENYLIKKCNEDTLNKISFERLPIEVEQV